MMRRMMLLMLVVFAVVFGFSTSSYAWDFYAHEIADYAESHYYDGQPGPENGQCANFVQVILEAMTGIRVYGWWNQAAYDNDLQHTYGGTLVSLSEVKRGDIMTVTHDGGIPHVAIVSRYESGQLYLTETWGSYDHKVHIAYPQTRYLSEPSIKFWRIGKSEDPEQYPTSAEIDDNYRGGGWNYLPNTNWGGYNSVQHDNVEDNDVISLHEEVEQNNIYSMDVSIDQRIMTVNINTGFSEHYGSDGKLRTYGDLFISTDGWNPSGAAPYHDDTYVNGETWEYVFSVREQKLYDIRGAQDAILTTDSRELFDYHQGTYGYDWDSFETGSYRHQQEVWIDPSHLTAIGDGSAEKQGGVYALNFDISKTGLFGNVDFGFHWATTCANDVIEGSAALYTGTPEPSTIMLLGVGLLGIVMGRKHLRR